MDIKVTFAMVDVRGRGRAALCKKVEAEKQVPFTITGFLTHTGNDDGTSIEFYAQVDSAVIGGQIVKREKS